MNRIKLRITANGSVCGLWDDAIDWTSLGRVSVKRASHVEFCDRRQLWCVRSSRPRNALRRLLQWVLRRPCGEVLHRVATRSAALAWEQRHFGPGGEGWIAESSSAGTGLFRDVWRRALHRRIRSRPKPFMHWTP